jgi:hypothetical protein
MQEKTNTWKCKPGTCVYLHAYVYVYVYKYEYVYVYVYVYVRVCVYVYVCVCVCVCVGLHLRVLMPRNSHTIQGARKHASSYIYFHGSVAITVAFRLRLAFRRS